MATKDTKKKSWEDRKIRIKLFKDNERYKEDVTVVVNGKVRKIQRGKEVEIPMYVWKVIQKGMEQDFNTATLIQTEEEAFKSKEKSFT